MTSSPRERTSPRPASSISRATSSTWSFGNTIPAGQRSIGITGDFAAGKTGTIDLSSLVFTAFEEKPTKVTLHLDGVEVGSADIDATVIPNRDETGQATVQVPVPGDTGEVADLRIVTTFADGSVDTDVTVVVEVAPKPATPAGKYFYVSNNWTDTIAATEFAYGRPGDEVLVGDWDGDGKETLAVRRGKTLFVNNALVGGNAPIDFKYGRETDAPFAGDFDGDGLDTISLRRGHTFIINNALRGGNVGDTLSYGRAGDDVFIGDWDGDGVDTPAVRR